MSPLEACGRDGCAGAIEDGYCNVCGLAPRGGAPAPVPAASGTPAASGAAAAEERHSRTVGTRYPGTTGTRGSRGTSSSGLHSTRSRGKRTTGRGNLGAGLVVVPPVPEKDPSLVVMRNAEVPERKRWCASCDQPVGRSRGDNPGRTTGFCPHCGAQFSFVPALRVGDVVAGQYEVVGPLAHGGLGWIYLARDRNVSDRWVVLKGLLNSNDPSAMAAAIAERRFLAQVEHPAIVRIYNFVTHQSAGYIVMEYVGGASLRDLRKQPLPVARAIAYLLEILPALGYLHDRGLLYCDFKPDNVMQHEEQLKLIDLGGVRSLDDQESDLYGTVGYQAPEVAEVGASVSSDLYTAARSLAVMAFDLPGFQDPKRWATSLPPAGDVEVLRHYEPFDRFLRRGTDPDPNSRFASAGEMADQLLGVLRQVVAIDGGHPDPAPSRVFTGELAVDPARPSWRALPAPLVDSGDPGARMLAGLAAASPDQVIGALQAVVPSPETRYQLARAHLELGDHDGVATVLAEAEKVEPGDWRTRWWEGILALAADRPDDAWSAFDAVAGALPGELAPVLAMAMSAEMANLQRAETGAAPDGPGGGYAAPLYQRVAATDSLMAGAAFGLARIRAAVGDRSGAGDALAAVPARSNFHRAAQEQRCRVLLSGREHSDREDIQTAAAVLHGLDTDDLTRLELTRDLLVAALDNARDWHEPPPGVPKDETGIRLDLEKTYRRLARLATSDAERIALVDRANQIRPRTRL